jgi:hypothetical protein
MYCFLDNFLQEVGKKPVNETYQCSDALVLTTASVRLVSFIAIKLQPNGICVRNKAFGCK